MSSQCLICGEPSPTGEFCPPCRDLHRWISAYFAHLPDLAGKITAETHFVRELGIESLDWMTWVLEAEEKLNIVIPDEKTEEIQTVGEFIRFLRQADASWPANRDLVLRPRRHSWNPLIWDVVEKHPAGRDEP